MRKFKFLKVNAAEIDLLYDFINTMAAQGWHPVNSWTRFVFVLTFEYDPFKKGDYAVVYNQYKTSVQLTPNGDKSHLKSSIEFDESLADSDIEKITTFQYFDILYSSSEEKILENLKVGDAIKKRVGKKQLSQNLFAMVLYIFCLGVYYSIYSDSIVSLLETGVLMLLFLYSSLVVGGIVDVIVNYRLSKGYPVRKSKKWENLSNFNFQSISIIFAIGCVVLILSSMFYLINATYSALITTLVLILLMIVMVRLWNYIDKKVSKFNQRTMFKIAVSLALVWVYFYINISILFSPYTTLNQTIKSKNSNLVSAICSDELTHYSNNSFFVQKYNIYCDNSTSGNDVVVYEFKNQFSKDKFKHRVLNELGITEYEQDVVFKHDVNSRYDTKESHVLVTDRYIYLSLDKLDPIDIDFFIEGRH